MQQVDFPVWVVVSPDREASRPGVTRQSITKIWLAGLAGHPPDFGRSVVRRLCTWEGLLKACSVSSMPMDQTPSTRHR